MSEQLINEGQSDDDDQNRQSNGKDELDEPEPPVMPEVHEVVYHEKSLCPGYGDGDRYAPSRKMLRCGEHCSGGEPAESDPHENVDPVSHASQKRILFHGSPPPRI
jgi:hypothetical protein